jgi:hypothetical protein
MRWRDCVLWHGRQNVCHKFCIHLRYIYSYEGLLHLLLILFFLIIYVFIYCYQHLPPACSVCFNSRFAHLAHLQLLIYRQCFMRDICLWSVSVPDLTFLASPVQLLSLPKQLPKTVFSASYRSLFRLPKKSPQPVNLALDGSIVASSLWAHVSSALLLITW